MLEVKGANQAQRPRHMYTRYNSTKQSKSAQTQRVSAIWDIATHRGY